MPLNKKMVADLDAPLPGDGPEDGVMIAPDEDYFFTVALEKIQELQRMAPFLLRDGAELVLQVPIDDYLSQFFGLFSVCRPALQSGEDAFHPGDQLGEMVPRHHHALLVQRLLEADVHVGDDEGVAQQQCQVHRMDAFEELHGNKKMSRCL